MQKVNLHTDVNGRALQSLAPIQGTTVTASISGTSARMALPSNTNVVRLSCSGNCHVAFGNSGVVAADTDMGFPAGVEIFTLLADWTHVAVVSEGSATGTFTLTGMG